MVAAFVVVDSFACVNNGDAVDTHCTVFGVMLTGEDPEIADTTLAVVVPVTSPANAELPSRYA